MDSLPIRPGAPSGVADPDDEFEVHDTRISPCVAPPAPARPKARRRYPPPEKPPAFYIPVNLPPDLFRPEDRDYGYFFLNDLHWRYVCWRADDDGFVPVHAAVRRRFIPEATWGRIWRACLGTVVESDNTVAPGKSLGWRLAADYRKVRRVECENDSLAAKIRRRQVKEEVGLLPVHSWLRDHLDLLDFDLPRAERVIPSLVPDPGGAEITPDEYRLLVGGQCQRLADGERRLSRDRFGRVHTPLTRLPRELRCCLSVGGEPLAGLDLANSQPLMLGLLCRRWCRSAYAAKRMACATFADGKGPYAHKAVPEMGPSVRLPEDVVEYLRVCEAGRLYESLGDREKVKKAFLQILMGPNEYGSKYKDAFTDRYPTVAGMLHRVKAKEHARAAWLLQNLESTVFIHRICGRLMRDRPELPVYTIHDSIYTVPAGLGAVREAILGEFGEVFGIVPRLKGC